MSDKTSNSNSKLNDNKLFNPSPLSLFVASVVVIFVAEALVMVLISIWGLPDNWSLGLIDATLLSIFVVPTLYFMLFKPMRDTIAKLDQSEKVQQQLKEIDQLKSEFISIAAHELCSPVSTIAGYTELLLAGSRPEEQKKYLEVILSRTEALERIIDDLQVVDNLDSGENLNIDKADNDLLETVLHVVNVYQSRFPEKPFHLDLPAESLILSFDKVRIAQVMDNLISNAVKYDNDIHDNIDIAVTDHADHVKIVVRDEGIGMTPEDVKLVFNKFFRAQTEKTLVGGLGLGMAIVKNIIDGHDGEIEITSQRKVGTTVTVTLPK